MKFYPYDKVGGGRNFFSHAEMGTQVLGSFYAVAWSFGHIEGGGGGRAQTVSTP